MRIHFLPLSIAGAADPSSGDIFVSSKPQSHPVSLWDTVMHELCHLLTGETIHSNYWYRRYKLLGGTGEAKNVDLDLPYAFNIGNISGIQNILTDYHLLQAYRRFSQKILGTEGHWEVIGEVDGGPGDQLIRLYPTPKGAFPVVVLYTPVVNHFRSPQAKLIANEMLVAETKCMVGAARRKIAGIPMPDGGSLALDGEVLAKEGQEEKERIIEKAISLGEPMSVYKW